MHYDKLCDRRQKFVFLINCEVTANGIYAGIAVFRGGMSGVIAVTDGTKEWEISIPKEVKQNANWLTFVDRNDKFYLSVADHGRD